MGKIPYNVIDGVLIATGISISLADIHQILSIIILVLNVSWILAKLIIKVIQKIKSGKDIETISDDIKDAKDELEHLDNQIEQKDSNGDK